MLILRLILSSFGMAMAIAVRENLTGTNMETSRIDHRFDACQCAWNENLLTAMYLKELESSQLHTHTHTRVMHDYVLKDLQVSTYSNHNPAIFTISSRG